MACAAGSSSKVYRSTRRRVTAGGAGSESIAEALRTSGRSHATETEFAKEGNSRIQSCRDFDWSRLDLQSAPRNEQNTSSQKANLPGHAWTKFSRRRLE
eukprot:5840807-Pyramimonas_sp.AAC.1